LGILHQIHCHISPPSQVCHTRSPSQNSPSPSSLSRLEFRSLHHPREGVTCHSIPTWLYQQKLVSGIKNIPYIAHVSLKIRFFTPINSLCLLPHNLLSFGSFKTKNTTNQVIDLCNAFKLWILTPESVNILKTSKTKLQL
jgi:hypothetical protein